MAQNKVHAQILAFYDHLSGSFPFSKNWYYEQVHFLSDNTTSIFNHKMCSPFFKLLDMAATERVPTYNNVSKVKVYSNMPLLCSHASESFLLWQLDEQLLLLYSPSSCCSASYVQ